MDSTTLRDLRDGRNEWTNIQSQIRNMFLDLHEVIHTQQMRIDSLEANQELINKRWSQTIFEVKSTFDRNVQTLALEYQGSLHEIKQQLGKKVDGEDVSFELASKVDRNSFIAEMDRRLDALRYDIVMGIGKKLQEKLEEADLQEVKKEIQEIRDRKADLANVIPLIESKMGSDEAIGRFADIQVQLRGKASQSEVTAQLEMKANIQEVKQALREKVGSDTLVDILNQKLGHDDVLSIVESRVLPQISDLNKSKVSRVELDSLVQSKLTESFHQFRSDSVSESIRAFRLIQQEADTHIRRKVDVDEHKISEKRLLGEIASLRKAVDEKPNRQETSEMLESRLLAFQRLQGEEHVIQNESIRSMITENLSLVRAENKNSIESIYDQCTTKMSHLEQNVVRILNEKPDTEHIQEVFSVFKSRMDDISSRISLCIDTKTFERATSVYATKEDIVSHLTRRIEPVAVALKEIESALSTKPDIQEVQTALRAKVSLPEFEATVQKLQEAEAFLSKVHKECASLSEAKENLLLQLDHIRISMERKSNASDLGSIKATLAMKADAEMLTEVLVKIESLSRSLDSKANTQDVRVRFEEERELIESTLSTISKDMYRTIQTTTSELDTKLGEKADRISFSESVESITKSALARLQPTFTSYLESLEKYKRDTNSELTIIKNQLVNRSADDNPQQKSERANLHEALSRKVDYTEFIQRLSHLEMTKVDKHELEKLVLRSTFSGRGEYGSSEGDIRASLSRDLSEIHQRLSSKAEDCDVRELKQMMMHLMEHPSTRDEYHKTAPSKESSLSSLLDTTDRATHPQPVSHSEPLTLSSFGSRRYSSPKHVDATNRLTRQTQRVTFQDELVGLPLGPGRLYGSRSFALADQSTRLDDYTRLQSGDASTSALTGQPSRLSGHSSRIFDQ